MPTRVVVIDRTPDSDGRFHCFVDGYMESLTIEDLREHVARTGQLEEREQVR